MPVSPYLLGVLIAVTLGGAVTTFWLQRRDLATGRKPGEAPDRPRASPTPSPFPPAPLPPPPVPRPPGPGLTSEERARVDRLVAKLQVHATIAATDIAQAESLLRSHPAEKDIGDLLEVLLINWSSELSRQRNYALAAEALRRAIALRPDRMASRIALARALASSGDWPGVEREARSALALDGESQPALEVLGQALWRLGRDREAVAALEAALARGESVQARALLAHLRKEMRDESGMKEQDLSAFSVRYDGDTHEDIGREVLRVLDRHFATLVVVFDHRPSAPVPVILFTRRAYYEATSAPSWSGGQFDNLDGRIRVPVGGLAVSELTDQLDDTLVHELTHAFVADISRGTAPRELHEGLAQYMEGKRLEEILSEDQLGFLADGRVRGVPGLYMNALALCEYLMDLRGQGGINDLLRAMGETRGVDTACQRVYGQSFGELQAATRARLRQRYGS